MNKNVISIKTVLFGVILTFAVNICLALMAAFLIHQNTFSFDSAAILAVLSVLIAAFAGGLFCVVQSGVRLTGYACGAAVIVLFAALGFAVFGTDIGFPALSKTAVAVFVGIFLGNFFGKLQHNKLRKSTKKRALHTK